MTHLPYDKVYVVGNQSIELIQDIQGIGKLTNKQSARAREVLRLVGTDEFKKREGNNHETTTD